MSNADLDIEITANNSSGSQKLFLTKHGDSYSFTLCGEYKGKPIQIDFDDIGTDKLEDLKTQIEIILAENN